MKSLILLHGALGSETLFDPLAQQLENEYKIYSFNLSGHGKAPFNEKGFGIEVFAQELSAFRASKQLVKPTIFGYSMGGYIALYLEALQPGSFEKILTLGTKFGWNPEAAGKEASRLNPEIIAQKVPAFADMLAVRHGDQWSTLLEATAGMMKALGHKPLLSQSVLSAVQIPVTIMRGDQDQMVSREESEAAVTDLPNATYVELPDTLHPIEKTAPALLAAKIKACS
ncbi:MAG: hypothetical protein Roseis2KO_46340 [Roseivirga sp.]